MVPGLDMAHKFMVDGKKNRFLPSVQAVKHSLWIAILVSGIFYSHSLFAASDGEPVVSTKATVEPINLMEEGLEVAGYLLILMVFAAVVIRLGRRFQPRMGAGGLIQIEDGHNLAPGVGVRLIRVGSRAWLVGVTRERVSLLAEMSREEMESAKEGVS